MPEPLNEPERIIAAAIERLAKGDPIALARAIMAELRQAGYEIVPKPDLIPIRRNPA